MRLEFIVNAAALTIIIAILLIRYAITILLLINQSTNTNIN